MAVQVLKNTSFFYACKENYFSGIFPADPQSKNKEGYKTLVNLAKTYFSAGLYDPIVQYLSEGRYLMPLWSAYLTLEYGDPGNELKADCIKIIQTALEPSTTELSEQQESFFRSYLERV